MWGPPAGSIPPPVPVASFTATAPPKIKGTKKLKMTLRCLGDTQCLVTYGASVKVPGAGKLAIKDKSSTLAARTDKVVALKLDKDAKRAVKNALQAGKKLSYKVSVVARQPGGGLIRSLKLKVDITS